MFAEDLSAFFDVSNGFAVTATLAGVVCTGIFDNGYTRANLGGMGMASSQPTLTLPSASVPAQVLGWFSSSAEPPVAVDLHVTIGQKVYQIVAHEPDGTGISVLVLELVT